jgi:DNA-binding transcriptional ArsR family regulator
MKKSKSTVATATTASVPQVELNYDNVRKVSLVLRALNHKLRQQIIELIQTQTDNGHKPTVTDLYILLRLEQSVCSQHLAILRRANVVTTERQGKFIYYIVNHVRIAQISTMIELLN